MPEPMRPHMVRKVNPGARHKAAFTFLEIVIVSAVILILLAIVAPAIVNAKRSAYAANDISNLRQIGVAAIAYSEEAGEHPRGIQLLEARGLMPTSIVTSELDGTPRGQAYELAAEIARDSRMYLRRITPYRRTYVSLYDMFFAIAAVAGPNGEADSAGWLVSLAEGSPIIVEGRPIWKIWKGQFLRLKFDGSVVARTHRTVVIGAGATYGSPLMWFSDDDRAWKEWVKLTGPSL